MKISARTGRSSEARLVELLLFESMNFNDGSGYKNGFFVSLGLLIYYHFNCLLTRSSAIFDFTGSPGKVVCFWQFPNERDAIQREVDDGKSDWVMVQLDPHACKGVNWRLVFWSNPLLLFRFSAVAVKHVGVHSLRSFAHAYMGYLLYWHLLRINRGCVPGLTVLTANMISPISVAVNEFDRSLNLSTYYLEHAITPRAFVTGIEHTRLFVRSPHTKAMLVDQGVDADSIEVNAKYSFTFPPEVGDRNSFKRVGVAVNDWDSVGSVRELVTSLVQKGCEVALRVHDADKRFLCFETMARELSAGIESARSRSIREFLGSVEFVFVGNSSVLFDALVVGVPVAYYWRGRADRYDFYGVVQWVGCPSLRDAGDIDSAFAFYSK